MKSSPAPGQTYPQEVIDEATSLYVNLLQACSSWKSSGMDLSDQSEAFNRFVSSQVDPFGPAVKSCFNSLLSQYGFTLCSPSPSSDPSPVSPPSLSSSPDHSYDKYRSIGGWLYVFLIQSGFSCFFGFLSIFDSSATVPGSVFLCLTISALLVSLYFLSRRRKKLFFSAYLVYFVLNVSVCILLSVFSGSVSSFSSLVYPVIWLVYFFRSKRVKAYFSYAE